MFRKEGKRMQASQVLVPSSSCFITCGSGMASLSGWTSSGQFEKTSHALPFFQTPCLRMPGERSPRSPESVTRGRFPLSAWHKSRRSLVTALTVNGRQPLLTGRLLLLKSSFRSYGRQGGADRVNTTAEGATPGTLGCHRSSAHV